MHLSGRLILVLSQLGNESTIACAHSIVPSLAIVPLIGLAFNTAPEIYASQSQNLNSG